MYRLTSITTNKEAGWYLGIDDEVVYRIDKGMLEELSEEKIEKVKAPRQMSVDEVAWQKWHKYVTNVVDIDKRKVIWNQAGRGKATLDTFYHKIGKWGCQRIKAVASDGAKGFISSTKEHAKKAVIVLDHFHVKSYLNNAVDAVRKEELKKASLKVWIVAAIRSGIPSFVELGYNFFRKRHYVLNYFVCKITSVPDFFDRKWQDHPYVL